VETIKRLCGGEDRDGALAAEQHALCNPAADAREGIAAFVAKRAARFSGRWAGLAAARGGE
jgi:hypothetical protein